MDIYHEKPMDDIRLVGHSDGRESQPVHGVDRSSEQPGDQRKSDCRAEIRGIEQALNRHGMRRAVPLSPCVEGGCARRQPQAHGHIDSGANERRLGVVWFRCAHNSRSMQYSVSLHHKIADYMQIKLTWTG